MKNLKSSSIVSVLHVTKWVAANRGVLNPFCLTKKRNYLFNKKEEYFSDLMKREFSAVITKGELYFVALCPELGVVSQGTTEKDALNNLNEAVELYLEDKDVQKSLEKNPVKKAVISTITLPA